MSDLSSLLGLGPSDVAPEKPAPKKVTPPKTPVPSATPAVMNAMGLKQSDVSPADMQAPALETNPMPNTNPAAAAMGLGETDIAPGMSPVASMEVPEKSPSLVSSKPTDIPEVGSQAESKPISGPSGTPTSEVTSQDVSEKTQQAVQEIKKDPSIGEKILQMAKDTGKGVLELIQGFALGMAHSDKPLASEVREAEKMKLMDIEAQKAQQTANQEFQQNLARIQNEWVNKRFTAGSAQEVAEADKTRTQLAQQAALDRDNALKIAKERVELPQAQFNLGRQGQLQQALKQIADALKPQGK